VLFLLATFFAGRLGAFFLLSAPSAFNAPAFFAGRFLLVLAGLFFAGRLAGDFSGVDFVFDSAGVDSVFGSAWVSVSDSAIDFLPHRSINYLLIITGLPI
jgi:hypothetical protein